MAKAERQPPLYFIPSAKADGNKADGNKADGNEADGNEADGNKADGNKTDRLSLPSALADGNEDIDCRL